MPRPRPARSRRGPTGPSKTEQRRAAAAAFQPLLAVVGPLLERTCLEFPRPDGSPGGYPLMERSERACTLYFAPNWSWAVRVRYRDSQEPVFEVATETA